MKSLLSAAAMVALLAAPALAQTTGTTTRPDMSVGTPTGPNGHSTDSGTNGGTGSGMSGSSTAPGSNAIPPTNSTISPGMSSGVTSPDSGAGTSSATNPPGATGQQLPGSKATGSGSNQAGGQ